MTEIYFCLRLTESEHWVVSEKIENKCKELGLTLKYYRTLKDGHVPMVREAKIIGANVERIRGWFEAEKLNDNIIANPYRVCIDCQRELNWKESEWCMCKFLT